MKDKEKTALILNKLKQHFTSWGRERSNILFPELRLGSGYCGVAQRRVDLFVINSGAGNETTAFEIKVSRNDFKNDLKDDMKQRGARLYANHFYYVTPKGLLKHEEIPLWAGLWELDFSDESRMENAWFAETVPAPLMAKAAPSWGLICSMIRHINKDMGNDASEVNSLKFENKKLKEKLKDKDKLLTRIASSYKKEWNEYDYWSLAQFRNT